MGMRTGLNLKYVSVQTEYQGSLIIQSVCPTSEENINSLNMAKVYVFDSSNLSSHQAE